MKRHGTPAGKGYCHSCGHQGQTTEGLCRRCRKNLRRTARQEYDQQRSVEPEAAAATSIPNPTPGG